MHPIVLAAFENKDTQSDTDSDTMPNENCVLAQVFNKCDNSSIRNQVPKVLEIMDCATKTYRVSSVALKRSPMMMCFINHVPVPIILDTGAENNVIGDITCKKLGLQILQTSSQAQQVDKSPLKSVG